jgi:hypothetical protein
MHHADTEHNRRATAMATSANVHLSKKLNVEHFTIYNECELKKLCGLRITRRYESYRYFFGDRNKSVNFGIIVTEGFFTSEPSSTGNFYRDRERIYNRVNGNNLQYKI